MGGVEDELPWGPGGPGGQGGLESGSGGRVLAPLAVGAMVAESEIPLRADFTAAAPSGLLFVRRYSRFGLDVTTWAIRRETGFGCLKQLALEREGDEL